MAIFNCENLTNLAILWESFLEINFVIMQPIMLRPSSLTRHQLLEMGIVGSSSSWVVLYSVFIRHVPKLFGQRKDICIIFSVLYQGNLEKA